MKKKITNLKKIFILALFCGCSKTVQKNSTTENNPSIINQISNFLNNNSIDFSIGSPDAGKLIKLDSMGKISNSMIYQTNNIACLKNVLNIDNGVVFSRSNKVDYFRETGIGVKVTRLSGTNSAGSFYGSGVGNKAWIGLGFMHGEKVSTFQSLKITAKYLINQFTYVNIQVDADGDFATADDRFVIVMPITNFLFGNYSTVTLLPTDAIWDVSSYGTFNLALTGFNSHLIGPEKNFNDFLSLNPNARFYTGFFFDGGYPKNCETPAISLVMGDSTDINLQTTSIQSFEYNGVLYDLK